MTLITRLYSSGTITEGTPMAKYFSEENKCVSANSRVESVAGFNRQSSGNSCVVNFLIKLSSISIEYLE